MRSRKKKHGFNSQLNEESQFKSRPFSDESQVTHANAVPNLQKESTSDSGFNFGDIAIFAPHQPATPIQAKLTIGAPGDKYEQEADVVAAQVVSQINSPQVQNVQREEAAEEDEKIQPKLEINRIQRVANPEEDDMVQTKSIAPFFNHLVQRQPDGGGVAPPQIETSINRAKGKGEPLTEGIKQPMERAFNADFSEVKVHTDAESNQLNQSIQAKAFTTGQDIFFKQGAYNPSNKSGQTLIAHELTHVVQQTGSGIQRQANIQRDLDDIPNTVDARLQKLGEMLEVYRMRMYVRGGNPKLSIVSGKSVEQIAVLLSVDDSEDLNRCFQEHYQISLTEAINRKFVNQPGIREYLKLCATGKSQSLIAKLLLVSGLATGSSRNLRGIRIDPEEMVTLFESASRNELNELSNNDDLKELILSRFAQLGLQSYQRSYIERIIQSSAKQDADLEIEIAKAKIEEFKALLEVIRHEHLLQPTAKQLTTSKAEEKIMKWAARQTSKEKEHIYGFANRYLAHNMELPDGYRKHILHLLHLNYDGDRIEDDSTQPRQDRLEELVAEKKPEALISYLLNKKRGFGAIGWARDPQDSETSAQYFAGDLVGHWNGFLERIKTLTPQQRQEFLKKLFLRLGGTEDNFTHQAAMEQFRETLQRLGANEEREIFDRILNAFELGASHNTHEKLSAVNQLRILAEHTFLASRNNIFGYNANYAVELVSQLQPDEYLEVIRNEKLMTNLKTIAGGDGAIEWQRISAMLGLDAAQAAHLDQRNPTETLDEVERDKRIVVNLAELNPEHWAAKLNHELEKVYLGLVHTAWDRNRVLSLVQQAQYAAERKAMGLPDENPDEAKQSFMQEVQAGLSRTAQDILARKYPSLWIDPLESNRLEAANDALDSNRPISVRDRIKAAKFRKGSFKRWFRSRGMRLRSLLNAILDSQGDGLLEWFNIESLNETCSNLDLRQEFKDEISNQLPAREFAQFYSTLLYKMANVLENDPEVQAKIRPKPDSFDTDEEVRTQYQLDCEIVAELLRFKALKQNERLNDSGVQWDWFSSKGTQRRVEMGMLAGQITRLNEKLQHDETLAPVDKERLSQARKRVEGKNARFVEMRETAKRTILSCVGLILAVACTLATGGIGSAVALGATNLGYMASISLSAARAIVLQAIEKVLDGEGHKGYGASFFEIIKDSALAATTYSAGKISTIFEKLPSESLLDRVGDRHGKFAKYLASNFGNISLVEASLRTATGTMMEAATSPDHQEWFQNKSTIFWNSVFTWVKDSLSKSIFDTFKDVGDFGNLEAQPGSPYTVDIKQLNDKQIAMWVFAELFTGQNIAVCEMSTLQDHHINLLANKFANFFNQALVAQRPLQEHEDPERRNNALRGRKMRYKHALHQDHNTQNRIANVPRVVDNNQQNQQVRNATDEVEIAYEWLEILKHGKAEEKINFLKQKLEASAYDCLSLSYTPEEISSSGCFTANEVFSAGFELIKEGKTKAPTIFQQQLFQLAYKEDILRLDSAGGKQADDREIRAVARGLRKKIQIHTLDSSRQNILNTEPYGTGEPAFHLVLEDESNLYNKYSALKLNPAGGITIQTNQYEYIKLGSNGDSFYVALSIVAEFAPLELRQMAFDNMTKSEKNYSIEIAINSLSRNSELGVGANMKAFYEQIRSLRTVT